MCSIALVGGSGVDGLGFTRKAKKVVESDVRKFPSMKVNLPAPFQQTHCDGTVGGAVIGFHQVWHIGQVMTRSALD